MKVGSDPSHATPRASRPFGGNGTEEDLKTEDRVSSVRTAGYSARWEPRDPEGTSSST